MRKVLLVLLMIVMFVGLGFAGEKCKKANAKDVELVKKTIVVAYIKGIHIERDEMLIKKGFHPEFNMLVKKDEGIVKVPIAKWMDKIKKWKEKEPGPLKAEVKYKFPMVEVSGDAAVARIEVIKDGVHVYTDFMALYKFKDGWKIVNKIYQSHKKHQVKKKK